MKILVVSQYRGRSHDLSHEFFKEEIANQHDVRFYGEGYCKRSEGLYIQEIIEGLEFEPDVVFSYAAKWCKWLKGMRDYKGLMVHFLPDYFPWLYASEGRFIKEHQPDLVLVPNRSQVEMLSQFSHAQRLPFSTNTNWFKPCDSHYDGPGQRFVDVSAAMTIVKRCYPNRAEIIEAVGKIPNSVTFGGQRSYQRFLEQIHHKNYVELLSRSKIVVNSTVYARTDEKFVNPRVLDAAACGPLLLTEPADDMKIMGFKPGINCDTFESISDMEDKIAWYLENEEDRERVARNGERLTRTYHSCERRVKQLTKMIEKML